jgi:mannan endo-1,4-beta-mannosidase
MNRLRMIIKNFRILIVITLLAVACSPAEEPRFVEVDGTRFVIGGETYKFVGTNFWYGAYLGLPGAEGDRDRLIRELDLLKATGITNLRILGASEETDHSRALTPAFQNADGEVNEELLRGLDFLLDEMGKRDMKAVVFMNNFWEWSGGMTVYNEWYGGDPTFDPAENGEWTRFMNQSAMFYYNDAAQQAWRDYLALVITRTNTINGKRYNDDPVIMSWQLANEPRPGHGEEAMVNAERFIEWVDQSSAYIKSLAPKQLVSTGNEGTQGSLGSEQIYLDAHRSPNVDYMTFHMWAKNWGWFDANDMEGTFPSSLENAEAYIRQHVEYASMLNKPTVLSEFGLGRDYERFEPGTPVIYRDQYLGFVFGLLEEKMKAGSPVAGTNFWTWGGYGEPQHEDARWRPGDPFVGDPPQEPQGLNSVFAGDESTLKVIRDHHDNIQAITREHPVDLP